MTLRYSVALVALGISALALSVGTVVPRSATAQSAVGSVTGRIVWGTSCGPFPMPMAPGAAEPATPDATVPAPAPPPGAGAPDSLQGQPAPGGVAPYRRGGLPAGAVLVAVQGTSASARTDENGSFSVANVPAGQYLTVAAGPVSGMATAWVARPNVLVGAGQTVELGTLAIGSSAGLPCRGLATGQGEAVPGVPDASP